MKSLAIIGSTGSIGKTSLNIYKKNKKKFNLVCLAANSDIKKLVMQKKIFNPKSIWIFDKSKSNKLTISREKFLAKYKKNKIDYIISGVSGYEAIDINFDLLKICKKLLIANKETIICGGKIFLNLAKKNKCSIVPIDSEHHCIDFFYKNFLDTDKIEKIYITASGGPFYNKKIKYYEKKKNVLKHPIWKMGKKISVDSSTFANKVLELFEAKILFKIPEKKITIRVDEKSIVHSIIKLKNNFYFPIIHNPNMEIPISNSLLLDHNLDINFKNLKINISSPDMDKFPIIRLGFKILKMKSHKAMILFTVFNERLVKMYLNSKIYYGDITKILIKTFSNKSILKSAKLKIKNKTDIDNAIIFAKNFDL